MGKFGIGDTAKIMNTPFRNFYYIFFNHISHRGCDLNEPWGLAIYTREFLMGSTPLAIFLRTADAHKYEKNIE